MKRNIMKIPKSFRLFGDKVEVVYDDKRLKKLKAVGFAEQTQLKISIAKKWRGETSCDDYIVASFYHEKVHMILDSMGEHKLSQNEQFVETFGRLLKESDQSAEY